MAIGMVYHKNRESECFDDLKTAIFDMTHAGQESYFFAVSDGMNLYPSRGSGIVDVSDPDASMRGFFGVGRNSSKPGVKPAISHSPSMGDFALAFDGYIINGDNLRKKYGGSTDGELAARFIADADDFHKGVKNLINEYEGHFSILAATERGEGYVARCPPGVRPLVYGEGENGRAIVTESRALSHIGMKRVRDIAPGEIAVIDRSGIYSLEVVGGQKQICSFLWPYYQMVDCVTEGIEVDLVRERIASNIARKDIVRMLKADIVSSVPESGDAYAEYYAMVSGIPYLKSLLKYQYAGRSYDRPTQKKRDIIAMLKLNAIQRRAEGKRIILWDDSIRRGTQIIKSYGPVSQLFSSGAKEVHMRIASPRNIKYCRYSPPDGERYMDEELAANRFPTNEELANCLKVHTKSGDRRIDSVDFIELDDFVKCITEGSSLKREDLCLGCYTGKFKLLD